MLRNIMVVLISIPILIGVAVGSFILGALYEDGQFYARYFADRKTDVENVLEEMNLTTLSVDRTSKGRVVLSGTVADGKTKTELLERLTDVLGMREAKLAVSGLEEDKGHIHARANN